MRSAKKKQNLDEYLLDLYDNPHKIGWLLGYDKLFEIHSEWIKYLFDSKSGSTTVLMGHRGSYKTTALVVGIIRNLIFRPNQLMSITRKSFTDAQKIVSEVKQHFDRDPLRELYWMIGVKEPKGEIWTGNAINVATRSKVAKERNLECYGIGTAITGSHFDKMLLDDIVTVEDRVSAARREATKYAYYEYINIAKTTAAGTISVSGTPWHKNDAYEVMPPAKKYSIYDIKPAILTPEQIAEIKRTQPASLFAANYELKHIADEQKLFGDPKYCSWDVSKKAVGLCDPAYGGEDSTALTLMYMDGEKIVVRGWLRKQNIAELYDWVVGKMFEFNAAPLYLETNGDKGYALRDFQRIFPATNGYEERMNKHVKIITFIKKHWQNIYFADDCDPQYMEQIVDYDENAPHDDAPDSLASLIREKIDTPQVGVFKNNFVR